MREVEYVLIHEKKKYKSNLALVELVKEKTAKQGLLAVNSLKTNANNAYSKLAMSHGLDPELIIKDDIYDILFISNSTY